MRVVLVVHGYPPTALGGTELYVEALARALRDAGDDVHVLTRSVAFARPEYAVERETREGVEVRRINQAFRHSSCFADSYRNEAVRRWFAAALDELRPDVVHVHHLTCLSADLPEDLAARGIPAVMTLHDYWMICHRGQLLDRDLRRCAGPMPEGCARCLGAEAEVPIGKEAARFLRRTAAKWPRSAIALRQVAATLLARQGDEEDGTAAASRATTLDRARFMQRQLAAVDLLLAPSRTLRDRFLAFGVPAERLRLQQLGIPVAPFRNSRRTAGDSLRIGFLGSLMVSKGAHLLLAAFARLRAGEATLRVFGEPVGYHGDPSYRDVVAPLLQTPGVQHLGWLAHDEVPAALAEIDLLVVPSIWEENSPLTIREAFAAGVPVVASDLGGMAEIVEHGRNGLLFHVGDVDDLHRYLRRVLDEPGLLAALRAGIPPVRDIADDTAWTREIYAEVRAAKAAAVAARAARPDVAGGRSPHHAADVTPRPRLAAVVLNYRTPDDTLLAVRSLEASRRPVDDLIVVDNGSGDGSLEALRRQLPGATVLATAENLGFSGGCNVGIREALRRGAELVLLLNSDAVLPPDALALLEDALAEPPAGIAGPLLLSRADPDLIASGGMDFSPRSGRMRHRLSGTRLDDAPPLGPSTVDGVSGCALLAKRAVLERAGLLAEEYFFSYEDLDLCLRARAAGFATVCVGAARAYHQGGRTLQETSPARLYYGTRNQLLVAMRASPDGGGVAGKARAGSVLALNLAHALLTSRVPRAAGLAAVWRGARDHRRGHYGKAGSDIGGERR
ncbi:MAG TPA: glycosyltransferase [Thermoanaerobaculia bacterium]|nr:glycosyltransferase [Thermoanaerobaculia bacterium]